MPSIAWDSVEESTGAGRRDLPSGGYVCTITKAEFTKTKKGQDALVVVWEITEGEYKGYFTDDFYNNKDFRHNDWMMLEGKALGITKHKLHVLADSNPGFDGMAAINADNAQAFVGKSIGLVLEQELYTYNDKDYSRNNVVVYKTAAEIREGKYETPATVDNRQQHKNKPADTELYTDEVPF